MLFVAVGSQCSAAGAIRDAQLCENSYPFDWVFSSPKAICKLLWELKQYGAKEVTERFLSCDKFANVQRTDKDLWEHYITSQEGVTPYNSVYGILLPHDRDLDHTKYQRRFQRLLDLLEGAKQPVTFLYCGPRNANMWFTVNGHPEKEDTIGDLNMLLSVARLLWPSTQLELSCFITKDHPVYLDLKPEHCLINIIRVEPSDMWQDIAAQAAKYIKADQNEDPQCKKRKL